ncbi:hypothetical protein [Streptomyces sp. NPDC059003]|uniref:hypothetical protein n=1 Tax=Streptomyces sp. NPDC059003 TaxID=3346691 RepID=UPI0036BBF8FF
MADFEAVDHLWVYDSYTNKRLEADIRPILSSGRSKLTPKVRITSKYWLFGVDDEGWREAEESGLRMYVQLSSPGGKRYRGIIKHSIEPHAVIEGVADWNVAHEIGIWVFRFLSADPNGGPIRSHVTVKGGNLGQSHAQLNVPDSERTVTVL